MLPKFLSLLTKPTLGLAVLPNFHFYNYFRPSCRVNLFILVFSSSSSATKMFSFTYFRPRVGLSSRAAEMFMFCLRKA